MLNNPYEIFLRHFMPKRKAYYRVTIDYDKDAKSAGRYLHLRYDNKSNIDSEDLIKSIRKVIQKKLPEEMAEAYHIHVDTHITLETEGSIVVVFSVLFGIYYFIGNISGFKESCKELRNMAERLLRRNIREVNRSLDVNVDLVFPAGDEHAVKKWFVSDYFWPMMVSLLFNVVFGGLILLLVWRAVCKVYF